MSAPEQAPQAAPSGSVPVTGGYSATGRTVSELRTPPASVCAEPLTLVRWEDTTNIAGWQTRPEVVEFATDGGWTCENVGWLVHEDDECVVLAARRSADSERHVGLSERIPKRAILHRETL